MNCQSSWVSSWAFSVPTSKIFSTHHLSLAFTAGGGSISGACPMAVSTSVQSPGQKMDLGAGCLLCWAPARSWWWRKPSPRSAARTSWCTPLEQASRSSVSFRAWLMFTSSQREAPLSGTPAPLTSCSEPSEGEWWTWLSVYSPALGNRISRLNWPTTSLTPSVKEQTAGLTTVAWWLIETVLSSPASWELWKASCSWKSSASNQHELKHFLLHIYDHINVFYISREWDRGTGWNILIMNNTDLFWTRYICKYILQDEHLVWDK